MTATELTVTVEDVSASYDHEGSIEGVDVAVSYETSFETNTGKRRVTYGAPVFRFAVVDGEASLSSFDSRGHERTQEAPAGAEVADLRALPTVVEIVEGIGDVDAVEPIDETIAGRMEEVDAVEVEPSSVQGR